MVGEVGACCERCKAFFDEEVINHRWLEWLADFSDEGVSKPEWPSKRREAWVLGFNFLLREIELGCIMVREVQFDDMSRQVTLVLPASKTDVKAKGCRRTLACVCPTSSCRMFLCPYHAVKCLVTWQLEGAGVPQGDTMTESLPLIRRAVDPFPGISKGYD